jgi:hypothetical protein
MFRYLLFSLLLIIIASSCSNDIDLNDVFEDIPVVYGILDPTDTAQYIRIERVFNSEDISALEIAKNTDSLYYKDITVKLRDETSKIEYLLTKVDGNQDKRVRENGVFATAPNYLYKAKTSAINLKPGKRYSVLVLKNVNDTLTKATINVVGSISFYIPASNEKPLKLPYFSFVNVAWEGGNNAAYYDFFVDFNVKEKNISTDNVWRNNTYTWKVDDYIKEQKIRIECEEFYMYLGKTLEKNENIKRNFMSIDFVVRGVGKELKEYMDILHFDSGITSSQQIPTYTNLSYGYGVFSSKNSAETTGFLIDETSRDSLTKGIYTKNLNFEF